MIKRRPIAPLEERTARLTILIDPRKKAVFERLCDAEDLTPSQVIRRLIREYIEQRTGQPWMAQAGRRGADSRDGRAAPVSRRRRA